MTYQFTHGQIANDIMKIFAQVWYQYHSNSSFLEQAFVRSTIECATKCSWNSLCRTATFDQINQDCSLYTEFAELGQLIPNNGTTTLERLGKL
jgi:hypothetical protein